MNGLQELTICLIKIFLTLLTSSGITLLWFWSPLKTTLAKLFFKKEIFDNSEFDIIMTLHNYWIGSLLSCIICFFWWWSLCVSYFISSNVLEFFVLLFSANYIHIILNKYIYGQ